MSDVQALQDSFQGDLTSFQGMLNYERSLRTAMGKLKHKWPAGLKVPHAMMLPKWCTAELGRLPDRHGAWP